MARRWKSLTGALFGRPAPRPSRGNPAGMIRYVGVPSSAGRVDTKAAAEQLGASQRTVQRWVSQGRIPDPKRSPAAGRLDAEVAAQHARREAERVARRRQQLATRGSNVVRLSGQIVVSGDRRRRTVDGGMSFTGEQMERIYAAQDLAGSDAAMDALNEAVAGSYGVPGMEIADLEWLELDR